MGWSVGDIVSLVTVLAPLILELIKMLAEALKGKSVEEKKAMISKAVFAAKPDAPPGLVSALIDVKLAEEKMDTGY